MRLVTTADAEINHLEFVKAYEAKTAEERREELEKSLRLPNALKSLDERLRSSVSHAGDSSVLAVIVGCLDGYRTACGLDTVYRKLPLSYETYTGTEEVTLVVAAQCQIAVRKLREALLAALDSAIEDDTRFLIQTTASLMDE